MARIRSIKPEFWTDEKIVDLSPVAKLLYIGIWNFADDDGYITDSARQLQLRIFPGSDYDIAEALDELLRAGLVVRFGSDQGPVLNVPKFRDHQTPNRPTPTKFTGITAPDSRTTHVPLSESTVSTPAGEERSGGEVNTSSKDEGRKSVYPDDFEQWWKSYPRREGKGDALKAWKQLKRERVLPPVQDLIVASKAYERREQRPQFRKLPGGWLRAHKWNDENTNVVSIEAMTRRNHAQYDIMPSSPDFGRWVE